MRPATLRVVGGLALAAVASGCLGAPAAPRQAEQPYVVAWLGGRATFEASWETREVEEAVEALGLVVSARSPTTVATPFSDNVSVLAARSDGGAWTVELRRMFWRLDVCSREELAAWQEATMPAVLEDVEDLLARLEAHLGHARAGPVSPASGAHRSDGGAVSLPARCADEGDGIGVVVRPA